MLLELDLLFLKNTLSIFHSLLPLAAGLIRNAKIMESLHDLQITFYFEMCKVYYYTGGSVVTKLVKVF